MKPPRLMVVVALAAVACQRAGASTSSESSAETSIPAAVEPASSTASFVDHVEDAVAPSTGTADE